MGCGNSKATETHADASAQRASPDPMVASALPVTLGNDHSTKSAPAPVPTDATEIAAPAPALTSENPAHAPAPTANPAVDTAEKDAAVNAAPGPALTAENSAHAPADTEKAGVAESDLALMAGDAIPSMADVDIASLASCDGLSLPGKVLWKPLKQPVAGMFCGSSAVNVPPEDRSILSRAHDGPLVLQCVLLFVNPNGGKKRGAELGKRAVEAFKSNSVRVTVIETTHARHAEEHLRDTPANEFGSFQAVVGIGGDGTMSEMINGLMARKDGFRIPLGLLAGGTGNSFMGDLQEWENMGGYDNDKLLDTVEETVTAWCVGANLHSLDLGKVTFGDGSVRYSYNCVLLGLGVEANVIAEQVRFLGPARYDVGAIGAIAMNRHRTYQITIDGSTVDYPASIVGIYGTQSASFRMCPGAKVDDGLLDFSGLGPMPRGTLLNVFDEMKRDGCHIYEKEVVHHRGRRIEIVSADGADLVNVDGENCGCAPLVCEVQPGAIQFLAAGALK